MAKWAKCLYVLVNFLSTWHKPGATQEEEPHIKKSLSRVVMAHASNPNTQEAEAGGFL